MILAPETIFFLISIISQYSIWFNRFFVFSYVFSCPLVLPLGCLFPNGARIFRFRMDQKPILHPEAEYDIMFPTTIKKESPEHAIRFWCLCPEETGGGCGRHGKRNCSFAGRAGKSTGRISRGDSEHGAPVCALLLRGSGGSAHEK